MTRVAHTPAAKFFIPALGGEGPGEKKSAEVEGPGLPSGGLGGLFNADGVGAGAGPWWCLCFFFLRL
jgi:hypothetical protein